MIQKEVMQENLTQKDITRKGGIPETEICGAIFDLDGVLLDSMAVWNDLGVRYLQKRGIQPEAGLSQILFSMSMEQGAEALRVIDGHDRRIVRLAHAPRRERDDRMVAVRAPARLHDITLRRRGRLARRRADALHIDEHARDLRAGSIADELLLEGKARAARRIHDLAARQRRAEDGAHARDLIFHLDELAAVLRQQARHRLRDLRGRRDRVAGEEVDASCDCTFCAGLIALHQSRFAHCAASLTLSTKIA